MLLQVYILMAAGLLGSRSPGCTADSIPNEGAKFEIYPGDTIAMWGDSLGDTNYLYWQFMQEAVDAFYTSKGLTAPTWINRHVGGAQTTYIEHGDQIGTAIADAPDAIVLLIGINDVPSIAKETSVANCNTFWDSVTASLPRLRRMWVSPWVKSGSDADIRLYRTEYAAAARARSIPFVDLRAYQDADNVDRTADGVHPHNPIGRSWISSKVLFQTNTRI
jgi:lysophospholipase L1-like esterase